MTGPSVADARREACDLAYLPGRWVPSVRPYLDEYARRSGRARQTLSWREAATGTEPGERLHFFPAAVPCAPLLVFVHGGYWQELTETESSFAAVDAVAAGAAFAAIGYGLAPRYRLDAIVAMVRRSVRWLCERAGELGFDPRRVVLAGHSAGAQLVAMCLVEQPATASAGVLLSGLYELEPPLLAGSVGAQLGLTPDEAARNSPARLLRAGMPPLLIARGEDEPEGFDDQQRLLTRAASRLAIPVTELVLPGRNHFDAPLGLADPADPLGAAVLELLRPDTERGGSCATS